MWLGKVSKKQSSGMFSFFTARTAGENLPEEN